MTSFGDRLREARQARKVTLDTIAGETNIGRHYLDALERSDFEALPGSPFDKGFIRSYAQLLGIDPQPALDAYAAEKRRRDGGSSESEQQMLQELSRLVCQRARKKRSSLLFSSGGIFLAIAIIVLGLLAAGGWFFFRGTAVPDHDSTVSTADVRESPAVAEAQVDANFDNEPIKQTAERASRTGEAHTPTEPDPSYLAVSEFGVGTGVANRRLIGESDSFPENTQVWFWTRVVGGESGESLRHLWFYEGRAIMNAVLTVGGPHWRTYSSYTLPPGSAGSWAVEVRNTDGAVLARKEFLCIQRPKLQTRR